MLLSKNFIHDLDLLVVYQQTIDLKSVRASLEEIAIKIPLDIIYMHEDEERELKFVAGQRAIKPRELWPNKARADLLAGSEK